ncbi:MAG: hypothetical protein NVS1B10_04750 [Candidatus Saccharimonadales bacterium]
MQNYNLGSGGTNSGSSTTYKLNGSAGEVTGQKTTSQTYLNLPSSIQAQQANVPLAPTLGNGGGTFYNKLSFIINMSGSPTDYTYSIAASTDNFVTTNYVQADGTLGVNQVYQTYTNWGGAAGSVITGLSQSTTYQVKVAAKQGLFTNSAFGPAASQSTVGPQVSFTLSPTTLNLGNLSAGAVISSASNLSLTFATNAASGGNIYIAGGNAGLKSGELNNLIAAYTGDLTVPSEGFGVQGLTASATSGGPLTISSPFNGSGNTIGSALVSFRPIFASTAALSGGSATASIKAKASTTTPAASDYQEVLTFVASASF